MHTRKNYSDTHDQKTTPFLLVSSFDLSNYSVVKRLAKDRTNAIIHTSSCEEIKSIVKHYRPRILYNKPENHKKLIRATDIPVKNPFDYKRYHDEVRNRIFSDISKNDTKKGIRKFPEIPDQTGQLVKKVLYGAMYPQAIKSLCDTYGLTVKGKKLDFEDFFKIYSKAVIATDLPGYELIIYLRYHQKNSTIRWYRQKTGISNLSDQLHQKLVFFSGLRPSSQPSV